MNEREKPEFTTVIEALAATFRVEATPAMFLGYWMGLEDMSLLAVQRAAYTAMRERKFMPTCVELRELAGVATITTADRAVLAWQAFEDAITRHGCYKSVTFDDPAINATIRNLGGWPELLERHEREETKWIRKDFESVYQAMLRIGVKPGSELAAPLAGLHDHGNAMNGHREHIKEPIQITTGLPVPPPAIATPEQAAIEGPDLTGSIGVAPE